MGRPLGKRELRAFTTAENIYGWADAQNNSQEKGAWSVAHPAEADALSFAFSCAKELGFTDG